MPRFRWPAPLLAAFVAWGCSDHLTPSRAEDLLRQQIAPEPIYLYMGNWDQLVAEGLLSYDARAPFTDQHQVTVAGAALGLEREVESSPGRTTVRLRRRACDRVFGQVTAVTPLEREGYEAAEVRYTRRHAALAAADPRVGDADRIAAACDTATIFPGRAVAVRDSTGWRLNHPPVFPAQDHWRVETRYEYDRVGRLMGGVSTATFDSLPRDPDGDAITLHWRLGSEAQPALVIPDATGLQLTLEHIIDMGRLRSAYGYLIATDPWGVAESLRVEVRFR